MQESNSSELTLHDDNEVAMTVMLKSCYFPPVNAYNMMPPWTPAEKMSKRHSNQGLLFHVDIYAVADKYLLPHLQQRAAHHVGKYLNIYLDSILASPNNVAAIIAMTNLHECLTKIYKVTAAGDVNTLLRHAVLDVLVSHAATRSTGKPGPMTAEVMRCAREIDGFGADMYVRTMSEVAKLSTNAYLEVVEEVKCPHCQNRWMKPASGAWGVARCIKCGEIADWKAHTVARGT
jgi:hypothetical protein